MSRRTIARTGFTVLGHQNGSRCSREVHSDRCMGLATVLGGPRGRRALVARGHRVGRSNMGVLGERAMSKKKWVTVDDMTPEQQIERLVQQRNALWKLLEEFSLEFGVDDKLPDPSNEDLPEPEICLDKNGDIQITVPNIHNLLRNGREEAGLLWNKANEIVGNTYAIEGVNHATGDVDSIDFPKARDPSRDPYLRASGKSWR